MNSNYWNECYRDRQNRVSKDYDGWLATHEAQLQPGFRVLDLGCGAGTDIEALLACGVELTAADFSPDAVQLVQEAFGNRLQADCFDMRDGFPYADESFDAVVSDLSLHYFSWADTERIVSGIGRILRKGGALVARLHSVRNMGKPEGEQLEENYYVAYGYPRCYFTVENIRTLFAGWDIRCLEENIAHRYGREKRVIEFIAVKR